MMRFLLADAGKKFSDNKIDLLVQTKKTNVAQSRNQTHVHCRIWPQ